MKRLEIYLSVKQSSVKAAVLAQPLYRIFQSRFFYPTQLSRWRTIPDTGNSEDVLATGWMTNLPHCFHYMSKVYMNLQAPGE